MNKVVRVFLDTDMRAQHNGLNKVAQKQDVHLDKLRTNEHVVFINRKMDKVKYYSSNGLLSYLKLKGRKFDLSVIKEIPKTFGQDIETAYNRELKRKILERMAKPK